MGIQLELPGMASEETAVKTNETVATQDIFSEVSETLQQIEKLTPEEQQQVNDFAKQIDLHNSAITTGYGEAAQSKMESYADAALKGVTGRDIGEIGNLLSTLAVNIEDFNTESASDGKIRGLFRSAKKKAETMQVKYTEVSATLERVKKDLLGQNATLKVDIGKLDEMYRHNREYYKELTMYILAGKQKLEETQNGELQELKRKAEQTGSEEDAFLYKDLKDQCETFEKRLYDLNLTRSICLQTAPQIRLVQQTDIQLAQKIQSSIANTIPIWKQKIAIALALQHSTEAAQIQKGITDLTSEMLRENAKQLHMGVTAAAREAERGIVDIEAIQESNAELLSTIDDVLNIQEEGRRKRAEAEVALRKIEDDLKQKLIGASQRATYS